MKGFFKYGFPMIELNIGKKRIELLIDTGFNGHIMLSKKIINQLNLEPIGFSDYVTASGEGKETTTYKTKINLFGEEMEVPVLSTEGDFSLAGIELFKDCKIIIEKNTGLVEIIRTSISLIN